MDMLNYGLSLATYEEFSMAAILETRPWESVARYSGHHRLRQELRGSEEHANPRATTLTESLGSSRSGA